MVFYQWSSQWTFPVYLCYHLYGASAFSGGSISYDDPGKKNVLEKAAAFLFTAVTKDSGSGKQFIHTKRDRTELAGSRDPGAEQSGGMYQRDPARQSGRCPAYDIRSTKTVPAGCAEPAECGYCARNDTGGTDGSQRPG